MLISCVMIVICDTPQSQTAETKVFLRGVGVREKRDRATSKTTDKTDKVHTHVKKVTAVALDTLLATQRYTNVTC